MSEQSLEQFLEHINNDEPLRKQVEAADNIERFVAVGTEAGYSFSHAEAKGLFDELARRAKAKEADGDAADNELSDEDLAAVAGGAVSGYFSGTIPRWTSTTTSLRTRDAFNSSLDVYGPLASA